MLSGKMGNGGEEGEGKTTPARKACDFAKPVHQIEEASDWYGRLKLD